jgi:outer membrane immunogenic protein
MKRVVSASIGLLALALSGTANAADLQRRGAAPAPAAAPVYQPVVYNWTGFYAGINGGWGFGNSNWADSAGGSTRDFDISGGLIGGTLGYNWQSGAAVFGVETDLAWSNIDGTTRAACPLGCRTENIWLGTARGRLGYAMDRWMPFISGGAAFGDIKASTPGFPGARENSVGWTLGGGLEFALAGNWTAKGEYLYVDLGDLNCSAANCGGAGQTKVDFNTHIVRAGLNYRF